MHNQIALLGSIEWKDNQNFTLNFTSPFRLADAIYAQAKEKKFIGYRDNKWNTERSQTDQTKKFYYLPQEYIFQQSSNIQTLAKIILKFVDINTQIKLSLIVATNKYKDCQCAIHKCFAEVSMVIIIILNIQIQKI